MTMFTILFVGCLALFFMIEGKNMQKDKQEHDK